MTNSKRYEKEFTSSKVTEARNKWHEAATKVDEACLAMTRAFEDEKAREDKEYISVLRENIYSAYDKEVEAHEAYLKIKEERDI